MAINNKKPTASNLDGNIDLGYSTNKKRFSVNGNPDLIIEFNPSDLGMATRFQKTLPKIKELDKEWRNLIEIKDEETEDGGSVFVEKFDEIEKGIRDAVDYIFDGDIADKLFGNASAFSPENGFFKYEHVITGLVKCYEQTIQDEVPKFNKRDITNYTHKYIKKK